MAPAKRSRLILYLAAAAFAISCGSSPVGTGTAPSPTPAGRQVVAGDSDNGKTIDLRVGDRLVVKLASTYWTIHESSDPTVLRSSGPMTISPQPSGCVPGGGCGLAIATFDAAAAGSADVTATRISCGEAMRCTGDAGSYRISVVVTT